MSQDAIANSPAQTAEAMLKAGETKASLPLGKMFLLSIMAGAFIAFGAEASSVAAHGIASTGILRLVTGCVFPVGLIMVVLLGTELFTGNCLMIGALCDKRIGAARLLRNWGIVWIGNLVGSLIIVGLVFAAGQLGYSDNGLAVHTIKIAAAKTGLDFGTAFASGILCNILVCVAVLLAMASKTIIGKIVGIWFPIMAFVLSGFEHSVANMYYIPAGLLAMTDPSYAASAAAAGLNTANLDIVGFLMNVIPVSLGNIVGGCAIGLLVWACYGRKKS